MESIDDWHDYEDNRNQEASWDQLSLNPLSITETKMYQDHLNWLTIATQWPIDNKFYQTFHTYLEPYDHLLERRRHAGFI
jgi:hypothetical protein